jgi:hypothetical protein
VGAAGASPPLGLAAWVHLLQQPTRGTLPDCTAAAAAGVAAPSAGDPGGMQGALRAPHPLLLRLLLLLLGVAAYLGQLQEWGPRAARLRQRRGGVTPIVRLLLLRGGGGHRGTRQQCRRAWRHQRGLLSLSAAAAAVL